LDGAETEPRERELAAFPRGRRFPGLLAALPAAITAWFEIIGFRARLGAVGGEPGSSCSVRRRRRPSVAGEHRTGSSTATTSRWKTTSHRDDDRGRRGPTGERRSASARLGLRARNISTCSPSCYKKSTSLRRTRAVANVARIGSSRARSAFTGCRTPVSRSTCRGVEFEAKDARNASYQQTDTIGTTVARLVRSEDHRAVRAQCRARRRLDAGEFNGRDRTGRGADMAAGCGVTRSSARSST